MKRVVQVYKPADAWTHPVPPGMGDYLRGLVHLHEAGLRYGFEVRADLSLTEFADYTDQTLPIFWKGDPERVRSAKEYHVEDHVSCVFDIWNFMEGAEETLYLSTNLGLWHRTSLPIATADFARQFFYFTNGASEREAMGLTTKGYSVLSVRCGDRYFGTDKSLPERHKRLVFDKIEGEILPNVAVPLVVISDSSALKAEIVARYNLIGTSLAASHASRGGALSVCRDLDLLANSTANFHINAAAEWWSGFSHYTSMICGIPSINIAPVFMPPRFPRLRKIVKRLI